MATLTISLPDDRARFAQDEARRRGFATVDAYLDSVLGDLQARDARRERLEALLIEGLDSGPAEPMTRDDWEWIRAEGRRRIEALRRRR